MTFLDWSDAFEHLILHIKPGDIILLDEISWMGSKDPSFIPKLKAWWDKQTMHVLLVFCGSVSTWIEENILKMIADKVTTSVRELEAGLNNLKTYLSISGKKATSDNMCKYIQNLK
jgi:hypothetical protein